MTNKYDKNIRLLDQIAFFLLAGLTAFVIGFSSLNFKLANIPYSDFIVFYTAGVIAKNEGTDQIYDIEKQKTIHSDLDVIEKDDSFLTFRNPNIVAFMYIPLANFTYKTAYSIHMVLSFMVFVAGIFLLFKALKIKQMTLGLLLVICLPIAQKNIISFNQFSSFNFLLLAIMLYATIKQHSKITAISSALLFLKPQFLLFVPFIFLLQKNNSKKAYIVYFTFTIVILIISTFLLDINFINNYLLFLSDAESYDPGIGHTYMLSYGSRALFLSSMSGSKIIFATTLLILSTLYIIALYTFKKLLNKRPTQLLFSVSLIFIVLINIHISAADQLIYYIVLFSIATSIKYYEKKSELYMMTVTGLLGVLMFFLPLLKMSLLSYSVFLSFIVFSTLIPNPTKLKFKELEEISDYHSHHIK